jgi:hypothetical protein
MIAAEGVAETLKAYIDGRFQSGVASLQARAR